MITLTEFFSQYSYLRTLVGTMAIGATSAAMGTFLYLRRQALMSDVIGHAATPGVMLVFLLVSTLLPDADPRSLPVLVIGALVSALSSVALSQRIAAKTRIGIDATMAVVLSLYLGGGLVLLQIIQKSTLPNKGGIEDLMFGNAATMTNLDVTTILISSAVVLLITLSCWRPLALVAFDPIEATIQKLPGWLSTVMFGLIVVAIVMGIKAVGLILMIAFAVFPPAVARQFSRSVASMFLSSAVVGAVAAAIGTYLSVGLGQKVPTGPMIVVILGAFVLLALLVAPLYERITGARQACEEKAAQEDAARGVCPRLAARRAGAAEGEEKGESL